MNVDETNMLITREFITLDEVSSHLQGITKQDLIEFYIQNQIQIYYFLKSESIFAISNSPNSKKTVFGAFKYIGIVKLDELETESLLISDTPTKIKQALFIQPDHIRNWRDEAPYHISYPNKNFEEYSFRSDRPNKPFLAFFGGWDSFEKQGYRFDQKHNNGNLSCEFEHLDLDNDEILFQEIEVLPEHLRIKKSEIEDLITQYKKQLIPHQEQNLPLIDELILKIINSGLSSQAEIWNLLKRESKTIKKERQFDTTGIIIEVNSVEITWKNGINDEVTHQKKTILNKISELKKTFPTHCRAIVGQVICTRNKHRSTDFEQTHYI